MAKAINKVVYDGDTLIDLTDLTVDTDKLLRGYTARRADGNKVTGTVDQTIKLIGEYTTTLSEYTNTSTGETINTGIDIKNTDYAFGIVTVTCDSPITTNTEWGMSISIFGRYTTNGNVYNHGTMGTKGVSTLSKASLVSNTLSWSSYGVSLANNTSTIQLFRKCHSSGCPKIRGGKYTVRVYGFVET